MKNSIKIRRKKLKLSQEELASLSNVTRQTILAIENNKYDPSLTLAFILARKLNTTVDELFEFEENGGDLSDF
ncbi:helix-turn-helix transcriptional regulator [Sporolactobacillus shoreicorticis]|uniref:Helix-turn-helix transcriptional regulator n=1 Tax=Sporolactobacillus shoreicorticis TaxID=1923877 RepID=A0ABW5S5L0_9BACL|nr:helix-turn-helix transcriptional regulator [Sporolactobacillus shoreicorticis]MCO7127362.1 helix-turn-helix transcriptional regulator [Sporolactobacillus shoreicorticis]